MLRLTGAQALSGFRLERALARIRQIAEQIVAVRARFVHFAEIDGAMTADRQHVLERLLSYGPVETVPPWTDGPTFTVLPRLGTISPWSSKATDIAHNCGLHEVRRLERGIEYVLDSEGPLATDVIPVVAAQLYDRMTETVIFADVSARDLFAAAAPAALGHVTLGTHGRAALEAANADLGLALSDAELDYLARHYADVARDPT
ncbi:MAG: phosphoribosylformylglycinamidine synthase, partial [Gammaproteobacteria bacterium]|nr:phosphoribosylformylglycinamidine synthase [Gammaproteobacteria bacterium]